MIHPFHADGPRPRWSRAVLLVAVLAACTGGDDGTVAPSPTAAVTTAPEEDAPTPDDTTATLLMWSRGELSPSVARAAAALDGVVATAFVRSGTVGLVAAHDRSGRRVTDLAAGYRIPVDVAAVQPGALAATLPPGDARDVVAALRPGEVLLPESSAALRGVGVGGRIGLSGRPGLRVVAVVADRSVRNAELVIHAADADAAGLDRDGSVIVRHTVAGGSEGVALRESLRGLAPPPVRIVEGGGDARHRAPLVLSLLEVKTRFGEFAYRPRPGVREIDVERAFVDEHIVSADVPILGTVRCHEAIVADLRAALHDIVDAGLGATIDPAHYGGCYYPRLIAVGRDRLSRHSWGIALDINVDLSQPGLGPPPPPEVVDAFGRHGFRWGGDFLQPDNHHFEWVGDDAVGRPG